MTVRQQYDIRVGMLGIYSGAWFSGCCMAQFGVLVKHEALRMSGLLQRAPPGPTKHAGMSNNANCAKDKTEQPLKDETRVTPAPPDDVAKN